MPLGTNVHNIELRPGQGGVMSRSAGSSAQLTNKEEKYAILKMPSGELRKVLINCFATVGVVVIATTACKVWVKLDTTDGKGIKPHYTWCGNEPCRSPNGGGEGRASGGHPRSRTGKYAKGEKTRTKG